MGTGEPAPRRGPMVVAALRFVDQRATVDPLTGAVRTDPRTSGPGEADRCALEHALRLAARLGGRCVAVCVGPPAADDMLRDALAAGADDVLRVHPDDRGGPGDEASPGDAAAGTIEAAAAGAAGDAAATANALLDAVEQRFGPPDLVICGDHSADRGTGATPAYLAERLGGAQALGLLDIEGHDGRLRALRRLDGGRRERLAVPLPAVCSVEPAGLRLRRAPLPAVLDTRDIPVPVLAPATPATPAAPAAAVTSATPAADAATAPGGQPPGGTVRYGWPRPYRPRPRVLPAPAGADPRTRVLALTGALVRRDPPRVITPADAAEAADELLAFLRQHGYLDTVPPGDPG